MKDTRLLKGMPITVELVDPQARPEHLEQARREFRVGNLYINRNNTGALVDRQPFGGSRMSGVGTKAGGPDYLLHFMDPRVVTENPMRRGFAPIEEDDDWVE